MCTGRLRRRVPSASPLRIARLTGHLFDFHKRSSDDSGKGNALETGSPADVVWGVIFEIDSQEKPILDDAEGLGHGYQEVQVRVNDEAGNQHQVSMYVAASDSFDDSLRPYSWYKRFVVEGARQHRVPVDYIARIEAMPDSEDPNRNRDTRNRRIVC